MEVKIQVWQSLVIALWVALVQGRLSLFTLQLRYSPLMTSLMVGIVLGDVSKAVMIGAALQAIYFGTLGPGGNSPSEPAVAAAIAVPIALLSGQSAASAVAVALPVGILGTYLYQGRQFFNTYLMKYTDRCAACGNEKGMTRSIIVYPLIISLLLYVPVVFTALQFGAPIIAKFIASSATKGAFHVLGVIGGGLAATGIAAAIYVIGKKSYILFFIMAFFMAIVFKSLNINMIVFVIFAVGIAVTFEMGQNPNLFKSNAAVARTKKAGK